MKKEVIIHWDTIGKVFGVILVAGVAAFGAGEIFQAEQTQNSRLAQIEAAVFVAPTAIPTVEPTASPSAIPSKTLAPVKRSVAPSVTVR